MLTLLMDEDSMAERPFWGWFNHRLEGFRKIKLKVDEDLNIQPIFHDKRTELTKIMFGVIPVFNSMGDVKQLPPVAIKSIADESNPNSLCSSGATGKIVFPEFMDPPNQFETINFTFRMTDVVRQKDDQFKKILSLMRNGTLTNEKCKFLINRFLSKVNEKNKYMF